MAGAANKPEHIEQQTEEALCKLHISSSLVNHKCAQRLIPGDPVGKEKAEPLPRVKEIGTACCQIHQRWNTLEQQLGLGKAH